MTAYSLIFLYATLAGSWGEEVANAIKEFFGWLWETFKTYIGEPIANGIRGTIGVFFSGVQDTLVAIWRSLSAPFNALVDAWHNVIYQFQAILGPYSFLTPLLLALLAVAVFLVVYAVIRYITPAI